MSKRVRECVCSSPPSHKDTTTRKVNLDRKSGCSKRDWRCTNIKRQCAQKGQRSLIDCMKKRSDLMDVRPSTWQIWVHTLKNSSSKTKHQSVSLLLIPPFSFKSRLFVCLSTFLLEKVSMDRDLMTPEDRKKARRILPLMMPYIHNHHHVCIYIYSRMTTHSSNILRPVECIHWERQAG